MSGTSPVGRGHTNGQANDQSFLSSLESQLEGFRKSDTQRDALVQVRRYLFGALPSTQTDTYHTGSHTKIR